jgi:hypothetical protein
MEIEMKKIASFAAMVAVGAAAIVTPAAAAGDPSQICLKTNWIDRTTVVNERKILFRMKDGRVYSSELRQPCLGLRFNGFVYVTSFMEVCGGSQSIRVLNTGQVCTLGNFTPVTIGQHGHSS